MSGLLDFLSDPLGIQYNDAIRERQKRQRALAFDCLEKAQSPHNQPDTTIAYSLMGMLAFQLSES